MDLGVGGPDEFPAEAFGFAIQWRAAPTGLRRAMRAFPVAGLVVQCDLASLDSTAGLYRSAIRQRKNLPVWLAMVSPNELMVAKVLDVKRRDHTSAMAQRPALTPRELDVLASIRKGQTNQGIALTLGISLSTVKRHVEHILDKLESKNRAEAAARQRRQAS